MIPLVELVVLVLIIVKVEVVVLACSYDTSNESCSDNDACIICSSSSIITILSSRSGNGRIIVL